MTGWSLALDFGTTATTAVILRGTGVTPVRFGATTRMPSGVFIDDDEGLVAGAPGANRGGADPGRYVRTPKRHVGRDDRVVVAGRDRGVADLVATVLATAAAEAYAQAGGDRPDLVVLTHPARWGTDAREVLSAAAKTAGLGDVLLVPEPVAAGHGGAGAAEPGTRLAVYDLGGGTFDAVVLRRTDGATWAIDGTPGGIDPFGGESFDSILHRYLIEAVARLDAGLAARLDQPATAAERGLTRTWWRDLRALKEDLSETSSCHIAVPGSDHSILVSRGELEGLLAQPLSLSVTELERTIASAGGERPSTVLLCGDASRMPLVHSLVSERFAGMRIETATDPKGVVAAGAHAAAVTVPAPRTETGAGPEPEIEPTDEPAPPWSPPPPPPPPPPVIHTSPRPPATVILAKPPADTAPPPPPGHALPPPMGAGPAHHDPPVRSAGSGRRVLVVVSVVATAALALMAAATLALSADNAPGGGANPTTSASTSATTTRSSGAAAVAEVSAAFDLGEDECAADGDEVRCGSSGTTAAAKVTTTFTRYPDAAAAGDGFDAVAARARKAHTSTWSSEYYAAPPKAGARPATAGSVLGTFAATTADPAFTFVATTGKLRSHVVTVEGENYDAAEQKLISLITDGSAPGAADVFGATFGLTGYGSCAPNLDWFTVVDGLLPDVDCFTAAAANGTSAIKGRYKQVATTFTDHLATVRATRGATVVKDTPWTHFSAPGVARGPYLVLDNGAGAAAGWRFRLLWADNAQPTLVAEIHGDDQAALEKFWADYSAAAGS